MALSPQMAAAIELARRSVADGGGPFGAVVAQGDRILGRGWNQVVALRDPTAHAEVLAIREATQTLDTHDLSGCRIFTSCEPCPMCLGAIYWSRLDAVHMACLRSDAAAAGFDDEAIYAELTRDLGDRSLSFVQEGREEGLEAFRLWNEKPDRIPY